jgi:type III secretion protein L
MSRLFSLIQKDVHPPSGKKIIDSEDFSSLLSATELLEKAKEDADSALKQAHVDCEILREKAQKEGFDEGLAQFNEKILDLDQEKKRLRHEMNQLVLPLALKAAKKIVGKELESHPDTIVSIVIQALAPAMQSHRITIWVNKADREALEKEKNSLKEKLEQVESLLIKDRDDIAAGGCIIETETGIINADASNQWRALEAAFERFLKHPL